MGQVSKKLMLVNLKSSEVAQTVCVRACACVSGKAWQRMLCRQLKLFINALLDNTPANPIMWQPVIRAFASLSAWLSVSLLGADMLSVARRERWTEGALRWPLIFYFNFGQLEEKGSLLMEVLGTVNWIFKASALVIIMQMSSSATSSRDDTFHEVMYQGVKGRDSEPDLVLFV